MRILFVGICLLALPGLAAETYTFNVSPAEIGAAPSASQPYTATLIPGPATVRVVIFFSLFFILTVFLRRQYHWPARITNQGERS
jgi:hypothetical protein